MALIAKVFFIGVAVLIALGVVFHFLTRKYLNPYQLIMVFGKKGSGKSTLLTKRAIKYMKDGLTVYSTTFIEGAYKISHKDIGIYHFEPESVIFIDEVGMIWDNRKYKEFKDHQRDFFKLQRHYKLKVYLFSQTFDVDSKIRDLVDEMFLVEKKFRVFSYAKSIYKKITLTKSTPDSPSRIDENLEFSPLLLFLFGSRRFTFIPKYIKHFNSFEAPPLKEKEFEVWGQSVTAPRIRSAPQAPA